MRKLPFELKSPTSIKNLREISMYWLKEGLTEDEFFSRWSSKLKEFTTKTRSYHRSYRKENIEKIRAYHREREKVRRASMTVEERRAEQRKFYYSRQEKNILEARAKRVAMKNDPVKWAAYREYCRRKTAERFLKDPLFKLKFRIRTRIGTAMKRYGGKKQTGTTDYLGCTVDEYRKHVESLWLPGMSWDNYGLKGWHIDHIKPCASFDFANQEEIKKCFHYTNVRPLWAFDNLSKGDRIIA